MFLGENGMRIIRMMRIMRVKQMVQERRRPVNRLKIDIL